MRNVLDSVLEDAFSNDMKRFHVWSSKYNGDDINTKFQPRSQIAPDYISAIIDKTMQSHNTIDMTDDFRLNVMRVRLPSSRGGHRMMVVYQLHRKAGVQPGAVSREHYDVFQAILPENNSFSES